MAEYVEVSVPARPEFLVLVRLAVGSVGSRLDLTLEAIDDVQLATEELCLSLLRPLRAGDGRLVLRLEWDDGAIEVRCRLDDVAAARHAGDGGTGVPETLSEQILDALVDDHGRATTEGAPAAWLRKRRDPALPST